MRVKLGALYIVAWLSDFAAFLLIFTVSRELAEQGFDLLSLGLIGGVISTANAISNAIAGRLSDDLGRHRLILSGTGTLLLCVGICASLDSSHWGYYLAYCTSGAAFGAIYPPLIAWINQGRAGDDGIAGASRTLVGFCLSWNLGMICGQTSGGWLYNEWGSRLPMVLAMILLVINLGLVLSIGSSSSTPRRDLDQLPDHVVEQWAASAAFARLCWIANLGGSFSMSMIIHLLPKLVVRLGVESDLHGTMLAIGRIMVICTYLVMYRWHFWHYRFSTALTAQVLGVVGLALLSFAETPVGLTLGLALLSVLLGYNYFASILYSTTSSDDSRKGAATGMNEATLAAGFAAGSVCGGLVGYYMDDQAPFLLAGAVITALAGVQVIVYLTRVRSLRPTIS